MSDHVVLRICGGNEAANVNYTGRDREITVDTGVGGNGPYSLRIHDGKTPGGYKIPASSFDDLDFGYLPEPSENSSSNE